MSEKMTPEELDHSLSEDQTKDWIGVDFDGTLVHYESGTFHPFVFGEPIPEMVRRVKTWLAAGYRVKVFTARASVDHPGQRAAVKRSIMLWCEKHIGQALEVTNVKDFDMLELWDDRAVQVEKNTGRAIGVSTRGLS